MNDWEELSDWYDERQGDTGDLWHRTLIDPVLLKVIGNCRGKEVLDLGCGNGYLARRLAETGAKVTAVDSSRRMIENAKAHDPKNSLGVRYIHTEADRLSSLRDESFDLVFANMSLMDMEDADGAIKEAGRVLRRGGRFVASISHPCFDVMSNSSWLAGKIPFEPRKVYRKVRGYRKPFFQDVQWKVGDDKRMNTRSFHRPLNWYARILHSYGLAITALEEPEPTQEFIEEEGKKGEDLDASGFLEVPLHLVVEAVKL